MSHHIVLSWFAHKVYRRRWIGKHHRKLSAQSEAAATFGLVMLT